MKSVAATLIVKVAFVIASATMICNGYMSVKQDGSLESLSFNSTISTVTILRQAANQQSSVDESKSRQYDSHHIMCEP